MLLENLKMIKNYYSPYFNMANDVFALRMNKEAVFHKNVLSFQTPEQYTCTVMLFSFLIHKSCDVYELK